EVRPGLLPGDRAPRRPFSVGCREGAERKRAERLRHLKAGLNPYGFPSFMSDARQPPPAAVSAAFALSPRLIGCIGAPSRPVSLSPPQPPYSRYQEGEAPATARLSQPA